MFQNLMNPRHNYCIELAKSLYHNISKGREGRDYNIFRLGIGPFPIGTNNCTRNHGNRSVEWEPVQFRAHGEQNATHKHNLSYK